MKTLLLILSVIFLSGCSCILSQIPPQTVYANDNCQGFIPDYRPMIVISDNCPDGVVLVQMPLPGTIVDDVHPSITVNIWGDDASGNRSNVIEIPVLLIDTVPPILSWPEGQIAMTETDLNNVYKNWEAGVKVKGIAHWIYDQGWTQGFPFADTAYIMENLKTFTHAITLTDEEYNIYKSLMDSK